MAFNVEQHANLGYIDRAEKDMVEEMRRFHKRSLKAELEWLIDQMYFQYTREQEKLKA